MQLNAPKEITWLVALVLGIIGIVLQFALASISWLGFVVVLVALVLLLAATFFKGL